ncbi:RNA methyltransferase [Gloeobacter kilaueensis]
MARTMKNFDLYELWLVQPRCSPFDAEARRTAVHATDILDRAVVTASLAEALAGCERVAGTTARSRTVSDPFLSPAQGARWLVAGAPRAACVFGPEDRGLSNEELAFCQRFVRIPTSAAYPSLNLAQAVTICAYEWFGCGQTTHQAVRPPEAMPDVDELEGFYAHLRRTLLAIGYLQAQTAERKLEKFRRLFNRSGLSAQEVALLRGVLRQVDWANRRLPTAQPAAYEPEED